jgi:hypothetical protein
VATIVPAETPVRPNPRIDADPSRWCDLRDDIVRAIVASATPEREDRLFPGDVQQFSAGGLGLAWGAAGVLYALSVTGAGRYQQFEEWLIQRAKSPARGSRLGLYDGLHGAAFTLDHLGYRQEALDVLDVCLREKWPSLRSDLLGGLAGIGLNLHHFADRTGEPALRAAARRAAEMVAEMVGEHWDRGDEGPNPVAGAGAKAGLMRGPSGAALLLLRAYDDTGDSGFLDRAAAALRQDLRRCVTRDNGAVEVNEGWRTMPYLDVGSIGIGMVLDEYLTRQHDEQFADARRGIEVAAQARMYIQPGLFSGRAGMLLYLAGRSASPSSDPRVAAQIQGLSWHALYHGDGLTFPGTTLLRLSMDLATGSAGILLALGAALHDEPVQAPLLRTVRPAHGSAEPTAPRQPTRIHIGI